MLLFLLTLLVAVSGASSAQNVKGHLVIIGGGKRSDAIMDRFIDLAGGKNAAHIIILPMASETPDTAGMELVAEFRERGVRLVEWMLIGRTEAEQAECVKKLSGATGVYFGGGDQVRITQAILGTPVHRVLKDLYRNGAVMGGTSAGAAIMSAVMITGNERINKDSVNIFNSIMKNNVETIEGIGFLDDVIIDQHFVKRKRLNRLVSVVLEHPGLPGIGIDESTALQVNPDGWCEILGNGPVVICDARRASAIRSDERGNLSGRGITVHVLTAGDRFRVDGTAISFPSDGQ